jgi:hypothetical protein
LPYIFFFFSFSLFFTAYICNGQVYPSPTLIFDNLLFSLFFNHHISKHNHSSTKL